MNHQLYLVTGAAGFLGGTVCRQLIGRGDRVRALVLPGDKAIQYVPHEAEICEGNLCDMDSLSRFFAVPEGTQTIVIHCASVVTVDPDFNQTVVNVNVGGTLNIIDQCLAHPECKKLVYVSSTGAIPELPRGQAIREVDHFDETKVVGCYSQSKARATQAVLDAVRERGLNACVVHPSGILGPEDYAVGETTGVILQIINGEMPAGIQGSFNLCDVRDLADGTIRAADRGRSGECYIFANREVTLRQLSQMLTETCGCKAMRLFLPTGLASFMAGALEKRARRSGKRPLMTTFSVYNLACNNCFDSGKAIRELGYHTRPYEETLRDEVEWLVRTGKVKAAAQAQGKHAAAHA